MHIEPYPATHIIKQRILVHAECNHNTEFKDKFADTPKFALLILQAVTALLAPRCL